MPRPAPGRPEGGRARHNRAVVAATRQPIEGGNRIRVASCQETIVSGS